jgi:hypothetical protein
VTYGHLVSCGQLRAACFAHFASPTHMPTLQRFGDITVGNVTFGGLVVYYLNMQTICCRCIRRSRYLVRCPFAERAEFALVSLCTDWSKVSGGSFERVVR